MGKIFAWMKGAPPCVFFHPEGVLLGFGVRGDSTGHNGSADLRCCLAGESSTKRRGSSKVIRYILEFSAQLFAFIRVVPTVRNEFLLEEERNSIESDTWSKREK